MEIDIHEMAKSLPPEALPVLRATGYLEPDRLEVGSPSPSVVLTRLDDGSQATIGGPVASRPTVLIFGSYT